ncbi:MAG: hypothetical protein ACK4HW_08430 [Roseinatronobacter sp.]
MSLRDEHRAARHQMVWDAAKRLSTFTYDELASEAGVSRSQAQDRVRGWLREGRVREERRGDSRLLHFTVPRDSGAAMPVNPLPRTEGIEANCWTVMRRLSNFSPTDLSAHATTENCEVSPERAREYCQTLLRAGYLRVVRQAISGKREAVYRLIRNTGPKAPRLRRVRAIEDVNLGTLTHLEGRA